MNPYMNINRVEFGMTYNCTGRCRHCSVGDNINNSDKSHVEYQRIQGMLKEVAAMYPVHSVMCFGGEPLLYPEDVCGIMSEATKCGIPQRQIITNGYFSKDRLRIAELVSSLENAGVTQILLSVDAFHQEVIPLDPVYAFASAAAESAIEIGLQPAWLVNEQADNTYNAETRKILNSFKDLNILISEGNNIFPSGNAAKNLAEYFEKKSIDLNQKCGEAPYTDRLDNITTISISPNGDVNTCSFFIGNVYRENITEIIERYNPNDDIMMSSLLNGGLPGFMKSAKTRGIEVNPDDHYSACSICREICEKLTGRI
ncbi:MAG: radical SAM protein [Dehalococcoidales bacterium]|nr:MAG: radical SAM protein [Dehalococcoidales bacterium]